MRWLETLFQDIRIAFRLGRRTPLFTAIALILTALSVVLAVLGGLGGYLLTMAAWIVLPALAPISIPRLAAARADWTILAFAIAAALANGILFGIAPVLRSAASATSSALRGLAPCGAASGRQDRIRTSLVIGEVAITVALVLIGSQLLGSFLDLIRTDPGFQAPAFLRRSFCLLRNGIQRQNGGRAPTNGLSRQSARFPELKAPEPLPHYPSAVRITVGLLAPANRPRRIQKPE